MMGGGMMGGGMMGGNQSLGVNGNAGNAGNRRNGRNGGGRPLFNIPAGKVVKVKLSCVCLEHGKAEPNPRIRYEVLPLSAVNQNVGVAAVVESLGRADMEQRVAQLAAWNLANGKTWRELATMQIKHVDGESEPLYTAAEIAHARELVEELQADAPAAAPSSTSAPAVR